MGGGAAVGGAAEENGGGGIMTGADTVIGGIPGIERGVVICGGIPGISTAAGDETTFVSEGVCGAGVDVGGD